MNLRFFLHELQISAKSLDNFGEFSELFIFKILVFRLVYPLQEPNSPKPVPLINGYIAAL